MPGRRLSDDRRPFADRVCAATLLYRERDVISDLPILQNGSAGTFVIFPDGVKVFLPTDQIVFPGVRIRVVRDFWPKLARPAGLLCRPAALIAASRFV